MTAFRVEFDPDAGLYLRVSDNAVARTVELEEDRVWVDLDESGEPVGIEVLDGQRDLGAALTVAADAVGMAARSLGRSDLALA